MIASAVEHLKRFTVIANGFVGAGGIVVSREYEEMRVPNLKAVGRAVRELT